MVLADSHKASPTSRYSGYYYVNNAYVYGIITLYDATFQKLLLHIISQYCSPTTPVPQVRPVWALSFSLATTREIIRLFSLPGGT